MASNPPTNQTWIHYLRVMRRRKLTIALVVILGVGGTLAFSYRETPKYTATAQVLIQQGGTPQILTPNNTSQIQPEDVQTQVELITSAPVRSAVAKQLGSVPVPAVNPVRQTHVINVAATSTDPNQAARVANSYANNYVQLRRTEAVNALRGAAQQVQGHIADLDRQLATLASDDPARAALTDDQSAFRSQLRQLQVNSAVETGGAQVVSAASPPTSPSSPQIVVNALIALAVSLAVGIGLAFLRENFDDSIKTKEDLERVWGQAPVLGIIPKVGRRRSGVGTVSLIEPDSPAAEAYRSLRTSIQCLNLDTPARTVQITSPATGEGKSTTLANLAVAMAKAGQRVIVVCCDLRRPLIHEFFGLTNQVGFTSVVLGERRLEDAIQPAPGQSGLTLLAAGPRPVDPAELLLSQPSADLLMTARSLADVLLLDCPPVLPVTDAAVLSRWADATLLVASASNTTAKAISRSVELLKQAGSPVVGTVLNRAAGADTYAYASKYGQFPSGGRGDTNGSAGRRTPVFSRSSALPGLSSSPTAREGDESHGGSRANDRE